ncbi:MAG: ArsR family transcriptional regulator [Desulfobacteraceae bacterium]
MAKKRTQTIRQEIINCLESSPMTVRDISQSVGISEKDVFHHLEFIEKTVRTQKKRLLIEPYHCQDCGFQFKKRKKYKKPGKCPMCRDGRIVPANFWIKS